MDESYANQIKIDLIIKPLLPQAKSTFPVTRF